MPNLPKPPRLILPFKPPQVSPGDLSDRIFVCGTNAFRPRCSWRKSEEINSVVKWMEERKGDVVLAPFSPDENSTALMTR